VVAVVVNRRPADWAEIPQEADLIPFAFATPGEQHMVVVVVELLVVGLVAIFLLAVLARLVWLIAYREQGPTITEAQARKNAAPLTTAILGLNSRRRKER
jgi:hypothetical protein